MKSKIGVSVLTASVFGVISQPMYAGSSWLSSVTTEEGGAVALGPVVQSDYGTRSAKTSATSVFNLTISLEENPTGDDDYSADSGSGDDAQNAFESKIEEFADAVFQMTNGKHKIGTVTMFRDGDQANNADVQWIENCSLNSGPRAHPSGFGVPGKRIYFCTNWTGAPNAMDTPKGAGFTLAHEWGHYSYGVYDEYIASGTTNCGLLGLFCPPIWLPRSTDTASIPSIMNNQWAAANGSVDYLEFSTSGVEPYLSNAGGDATNAHFRTFQEPAWDTLTRDPGTDPRHSFLPPRTQYTNLVAPTGNLLVNDNESTARSELDIVWAGDQVVELMIDVSGSMLGTPIANAKSAASLLVGQLTEGQSAVGVGQFSSLAIQSFPITDIPDPDTGVRSAAQSTINGFSANGGTDIEAAAITALQQTQNFQGGARPSVVFLLTDGQSGVNVSNVVSQYTAASVPLITFGFGPGVDATLLRNLADGTGGSYFFSPTSLAAIQQAFIAANAAFSSSTVVSSGTALASGGATEVRTIQLDSTLGVVSINVTYQLAESDVALTLIDSTGSDTGVTFSCTSSSEVSCETQVDVQAMGAGEYGVQIDNLTGSDKQVSVLVSGSPDTFESYDVAVDVEDIAYPESFTVRALVSKGSPLAGLDVVAMVTKPNGAQESIQLLDDGLNADLIQSDGVYSADIPYEQNGNHTIVVTASNASGNAVKTNEGLAISILEDGTSQQPSNTPVPENFTRVGVVNAAVTNVSSDDHGQDVGACTSVNDDNLDTLGRIDFAGDVDCFSFIPSNASSAVVIRATSLRDNIQPLVKLKDNAGNATLLSTDLSSSPNPSSGVIAVVPSTLLDASGHVITVEHEDASADTGAYALSVGALLASDGVETLSDDTDGDTVLNEVDFCPATAFPENGVPERNLRTNRFALLDDPETFTSTSRRQFTIEDTGGCSCEQILEQPGYQNRNQELYGCTSTTLLRWERHVSGSR
ncbi:VWA domain-containing protein [Granulosicoccus sp. 3-233]|uniref:VWA domain-containing protein n=1 Tax=Granulosicoccus sp. 3-233 TaxID=3417969 RepID=UPI003D341700